MGMTLADLLAELETLDPDEREARFTDIVAELVNHLAELDLAALAASLAWPKRMALACVVQRTRRASDAPIVAKLLGDAHERVAQAAALAAGALGRPELVPALLQAVAAGEPSVAQAAAASLARIGDRRAAPGLSAALGAETPG